jgi:hypothetical protein
MEPFLSGAAPVETAQGLSSHVSTNADMTGVNQRRHEATVAC